MSGVLKKRENRRTGILFNVGVIVGHEIDHLVPAAAKLGRVHRVALS